jgi:hypothetical protein
VLKHHGFLLQETINIVVNSRRRKFKPGDLVRIKKSIQYIYPSDYATAIGVIDDIDDSDQLNTGVLSVLYDNDDVSVLIPASNLEHVMPDVTPETDKAYRDIFKDL